MTLSVAAQLSDLTGQYALKPSEYPVELRHYPARSGMPWHRDDVLYLPAQLEVILTLENTSDSLTEWRDANGQHEGIWTEPNSILLVRAGEHGPLHRVTTIRRGERTILKFVFTVSDCKTDSFAVHLDSFPGRRVATRRTRR
eukprot:CAMPEP_0119315856 /NCGR_PEP_ID=MMETSP1333-20130426/37424_1 /TAXON_ID=418940 /ORGANISM="Scyphosphaera apsteinii, Strain RCC1455" /LENGTH=141 /DNA_ID=CAMNT_0007321335 /DNA_START=456 /DNA_END=881 /DNA_ORIENTATION=-